MKEVVHNLGFMSFVMYWVAIGVIMVVTLASYGMKYGMSMRGKYKRLFIALFLTLVPLTALAIHLDWPFVESYEIEQETVTVEQVDWDNRGRYVILKEYPVERFRIATNWSRSNHLTPGNELKIKWHSMNGERYRYEF